MLPSPELIHRIEQLRAAVRTHKTALGRHKRDLRIASEALAQLEAEGRRRGIRIIVTPVNPQPQGEGEQSSWPLVRPNTY
jgi:hypothetical protein